MFHNGYPKHTPSTLVSRSDVSVEPSCRLPVGARATNAVVPRHPPAEAYARVFLRTTTADALVLWFVAPCLLYRANSFGLGVQLLRCGFFIGEAEENRDSGHLGDLRFRCERGFGRD